MAATRKQCARNDSAGQRRLFLADKEVEKLTELYASWRGRQPARVERLPQSGSNRDYFRLYDDNGGTVIGVVGTSREENHAFIYLSRHFAERQLPVPRVIAATADESRYLQTDLGCRSLFDALAEGRRRGGCYSEEELLLLRKTIRLLPQVQFRGAEGLDWANCYPVAAFDEDCAMFDFNYFKYCFLKPSGLDFNEFKLEKDFRQMACDLVAERSESFLYRDFQARNVMLDGSDSPWLIDFQGGRRGSFYYDLASFLWQASAKYTPELRRELAAEYRDALKEYADVPPEEHFALRLRLFVLFRTMQVLGAYGYRGYFERKRHFLDSIPPAMENLRGLLAEQTARPYPYLADALLRLSRLPQFAPGNESERASLAIRKDSFEPPKGLLSETGRTPLERRKDSCRLTVRVYSFSYKKGIPADESGNGGGYVFDCRSTHNPGRYEKYKHLNGLDAPVIKFLEDDGEITEFLSSVYRLADAHVERYLERGFTDLMFCFGCTGGQHRSVYSAQHLAEHLNSKYGIEVRLCHREQRISQTLPASN